jgi:hypothetical protein
VHGIILSSAQAKAMNQYTMRRDPGKAGMILSAKRERIKNLNRALAFNLETW